MAARPPGASKRHAVVFIHGAWLTGAVWERFIGRYAACGYACVAPPWPWLDLPVRDLQDHPPAGLARSSIGSIVAYYESLIRALPAPPPLVGHAFGGLFVQMLLDRGLGAAGVAIAPVAPRGVLAHPTALRSVLPVLSTWNGWKRTLTLSQAQFCRNYAQTLAVHDMEREYHRQIVPAPGRIFYEAALGRGNRVDFDNDDRAPLLLVAGEHDRIVPPSMVASNYRLHRRSVATTAFKLFPGRSHWLIAEPGWEQVADMSIDWLQGEVGRF